MAYRHFLMIFLTILLILQTSYGQRQPVSLPGIEECKPYGVRLALGKNYVDENSSITISIWFNTKHQCEASYVLLEVGSKIYKKYCKKSSLIQISSY